MSSASVLVEGLLSDAPDQFLLHSGVRPFDLLRPHDGGESRAREGVAGEVVSMRALAVLLFFCSVVYCLYS